MTKTTLFSKTRLFNKELKNRFVLAPLTRGRATATRVPNDIMADYYEQRATAGLIISEATHISKEAIGWVDSPGVYNQAQVQGWKKVVSRVHKADSAIVLQLWHMGRASHSDFHDGDLPLSASAVKIEGGHIHTPKGKMDFEVPKTMTHDDIKRTVNDYKKAAQNAKDAGFDGVELHAANGYLINQFLDDNCNQRDDEYGGSISNRMRFLVEIISAVKEVFNASNIGVRISPNGIYNSMGCDDFRELYIAVAKYLQDEGIGYLHVMDGLAFGFHERGEPMTLAEFKAVFDGIIIGNCGYTFETATQAVEAENADMIAFGRPYITNPDLPERFQNGWELTPFDDMSQWYGGGAEGYSDYDTYNGEK